MSNHTTLVSHGNVRTLLPTVRAAVVDKWGNRISCRILLDSGSTVSFVTESFIQRVGVTRSNARISVLGLSACNAGTTRGRVELKISPENNNKKVFVLNALILQTITVQTPAQHVNMSPDFWSDILALQLADPAFGEPGNIDVLIGADHLWSVLTGERKQFGIQLPVALSSIFGWVITGTYDALEANSSTTTALTHHAMVNIDELFRSFMEVESVSTQITPQETDPAETHFVRTHTRDEQGTYVVEYPFKENCAQFGATLPQALTRFGYLEKRFQRNPQLKQNYVQFMREYEMLGHMERILVNQSVNVFYLTHHAVLKPDSTTTKCRVVFDGSLKDASGHSLNERLHIGPPIQRDLLRVCLRFRQHRFVLSADIEKMFRGIRVSDKHTNVQRIVWREDEGSPIRHYRLCTVTYGLASSPFLAVRVLKQLADDYKTIYPNAAHVLENETYVDDITTGKDNVNDLIDLKNELIELLSKGNFKLQKWCSNCWPLLETLPADKCKFSTVGMHMKEFETIGILGLEWNPSSDNFLLKIQSNKNSNMDTISKRAMLSNTAKIYDPLGIVAPTVVLFKILLQETWLRDLSWDEELPEDLYARYNKYMQELPQLQHVAVPRYISAEAQPIELHEFADASSVAYAAVVYSRVHSSDGYKTTLIIAKTRVAPLKPLSIPRLELSAAFLLTKLISFVKSSLTVPIADIVCWTDSEIVLHWLSSPPRRWTSFVCNRTAEIIDVCPRSIWRHVRSEHNPADCASRGLLPSKLVTHHLWWSGPNWLLLPQSEWPKSKFTIDINNNPHVVCESRKQQLALCSSAAVEIYNGKTNAIARLINKTSSWMHLIRSLAYCVRFGKKCRRTYNNLTTFSHLTATELHSAELLILQYVQQSAFNIEIQHLQRNQPLPNKSHLNRYTPFLDGEGVLRVRGRIKHSTLPFNMKHPILLPKDSPVSKLIIKYIHKTHLHTGVESTFNIARQRFWIFGCRNIIRKTVFSCKVCFMQRRAVSQQLMGDLPALRMNASRCFAHCGIDYAGPVVIKLSRTRNAKTNEAWFAIFVCMTTRAIHLEMVSDLTVDAFLAAFRRFIARRGKPNDMYSDNGTTFHGGRRVMDELQALVLSTTYNEEIATKLACDKINWHFIPPSAPHFGGTWESGIRSVKLHLRRIIGSTILTFEEFSTVLAQIEAIINSRPLCAISDTEMDPLTPAHFLIGQPYTCIPEPSLLETNPNRLQHWRHLQAMVQGFWKRWSTEYVTSLQQRPKWQQQQSNIDPGTLVVVKEPNLPPTKWLIGRVEDVHRGTDNFVRVATIRTARGVYKRAIAKLAVLPVD